MSNKFGKIALAICFALLLLIALAPLLISTNAGTSFALSFINKKIPGSFQVEDTYLSWFGKQNFYRVALNNPNSEPILTIKRIEVDASLLSLALDFHNFSKLKIEDAQLKIVQDSNGVTDLQDALGLKKMKGGPKGSPVFVENGEIEIIQGVGRELIAKATGSTRQNALKGDFLLDISFLKNESQKVSLQASHFPTLVLDQTLALGDPKLSGLLLAAFGDSIQIALNQSSKNKINTLVLAAHSPFVKMDFAGKISHQALDLEPGGSLEFNIPETNGERIFTILGLNAVQIKKPLTGKLSAGAITIPLDRDDVKNFSGNLSLNLEQNQFTFEKDNIDLIAFNASIDAKKGAPKMGIEIKAEAKRDGNPLSLNFNLDLPKYALVTSNLDSIMADGLLLKGNFKSQTPLIDTKWDGILKETHSKIDLSFTSSQASIPSLTIEIPFIPFQEIFEDGEIDSIIQGSITVDDPHFDIPIGKIDEITMPWILDMKGNSLKLNFIGKRNDPEMKSMIKGSLRIDDFIKEAELDINLACSMQLNLKLDEIQTDALQPFISPYPVKRVFGPTLDVEVTVSRDAQGAINGCVEVVPPKASDAFVKRIFSKFELQNKDITFETETQAAIGYTNFIGTLQNVFNKEGKFDFEQGSFCVQGHLKHFPVGIMAKVISGDEKVADKLEAILGTQVDGDIHAEMINHQGPVRFNLKGTNGQCDIDARIVDRVLLLNKPITASLKVTPQLEQAVLREYLPILSSVVAADKPIELSIPVTGFRLPLIKPSIADLKFQNAELKLDKMLFSRESSIGKIVSILGLSAPKFIVWFTPIYFSMQNGQVQMYRSDMLIADTYPFATWGLVDLNKQQLDLTVALSGVALKKAFGIDNLGGNGWFQVPIRGDIHHPKIDTATVTARISALAAMSKVGPPGKLIGTVIETAQDIVGIDKVPEPTTTPLPWQDQLDVSTAAAPEKNQVEELLDVPIEDLKKGAKKLLKGLFQ